MSEKKSFVMSFDYDESADSSFGTFGVNPEQILEAGRRFIDQEATPKGTSTTAFLVNGIEDGSITGGLLMALAVGGVKSAFGMAMMRKMIDKLSGMSNGLDA